MQTRMRRLAVLVTILAGTAVPTSAGAPMPNVNVDFGASCTWYGHAPVILAIEKGWFREAGLHVTFRTIV
ncbi:MAG: ABC transporter substrate-binding protein, partial [Armatimonadota bacterium]|nr:ABC transporter substrate-binding protein [Armatimonadota bacterium]